MRKHLQGLHNSRVYKLVYSLRFCFARCVRIIQSQAWSGGALKLLCAWQCERSLHMLSIRSKITPRFVTFMEARQTFSPHEQSWGIFSDFSQIISGHTQMVPVPQIDPFVPQMCHSTLFLFIENHLAFRMWRWKAFAGKRKTKGYSLGRITFFF